MAAACSTRPPPPPPSLSLGEKSASDAASVVDVSSPLLPLLPAPSSPLLAAIKLLLRVLDAWGSDSISHVHAVWAMRSCLTPAA